MDHPPNQRPASASANSCPLTPLGFLERAATVYGDCTSIVYNETTCTWSETHCRSLHVASSLSKMGIGRGHVVSAVAFNVPAMYEIQFAVPMCGAILNTINTRLDARMIYVLLRHSESKLVFVDPMSKVVVLEALSLFSPNTQSPMLVLIEDDDASASLSSTTDDFITTYETMVERGDSHFKWVRPENEWDPMVLNYTSGTTSSPKGVLHSHRATYLITVDSLINWAVPNQPTYLWTVPMFHSNGWSFSWGMAAVGGTNICLGKFDAPKIYGLIKRHRVTHMCAAPVVLNMLANSPSKGVLEHPVHVLTGGAPPPAPVLLRMESLGFIVSHGYGFTEAAGVVVSCAWKNEWNKLPAEDRARLKARQGVRTTVACSEVDVVDPGTGKSVKRDGSSMGEIVIKGGSIMLGYLKDLAATSACMRDDGWLYTGDMAVMHPDGYLEIKDRSKDVIISGGENISSAEVESVLYSNPAIDEAAVVARPDDFWGETPCAFVRFRNGSDLGPKPTEREIVEFCRERMPHFMAPKTVIFREELPKTSTGKIQKSVLREIAKSIG